MLYQDTVDRLLSGKIDIGLNPTKRKYWPRFAFHFTDIDNAIDILNQGFLVSREYAKKYGVMRNDNASNVVISQTNENVKSMVRLYFRPRTPTQYYNEGFQTSYRCNQSDLQANCPVPVFFLFDLVSLLKCPDVQFSDRSLASSGTSLMRTPTEFSRLPFDKIYHDSGMAGLDSLQRRKITQHKHAEIVVPQKLDLSLLKLIYVRSIAVKTTLLEKLHADCNFRYDSLIQVGDESTFYMDRNFIQSVNMNTRYLHIKSNVKDPYPKEWGRETKFAINPDSENRYLNVVVNISLPSGRMVSWPGSDHRAVLHNKMDFRWPNPLNNYQVEVLIDGHVAYYNHFEQIDDAPF